MVKVLNSLPQSKEFKRGAPRKYLTEEAIAAAKANPGKPVQISTKLVDKRYVGRIQKQATELDEELQIHFVLEERLKTGKYYSYLGQIYMSLGDLDD